MSVDDPSAITSLAASNLVAAKWRDDITSDVSCGDSYSVMDDTDAGDHATQSKIFSTSGLEVLTFVGASVHHSVGDAITIHPIISDILAFYAARSDPKKNGNLIPMPLNDVPIREQQRRLFAAFELDARGDVPRSRVDLQHRYSLRGMTFQGT